MATTPTETKKTTSSANDERVKAAASYFLGPITGVFFLVTEKDNSFIRFHAMQSTILLGALFILQAIFAQFLALAMSLGGILGLVTLVVWLFSMYQAYQGIRFKYPVVGDFAEEHLKKMNTTSTDTTEEA